MVLKDHSRRNGRLVPPFLSNLRAGHLPYSWARQMAPELLWLVILSRDLGMRRSVEVSSILGEMAAKVASEQEKRPLFVQMSSFGELSDAQRKAINENLPSDVRSALQSALSPMATLWPDFPLSFVVDSGTGDEQSALQDLTEVLRRTYDRHSREATLAIATAIYLGVLQKRIMFDSPIVGRVWEAFRDIEMYPRTDESKSAGALFRSMAAFLIVKGDGHTNGELTKWCEEFWATVFKVGECMAEHQSIPELPETATGLEGFVSVYTHFANKDFRCRQDNWRTDPAILQQQEVLLALLARQVTLAVEIISAPSTWTPNIAPILLRAMADVHITLEWILENPTERVPLYVLDGLGGVKLEIAHREEEIKKDASLATNDHLAYTDYLKKWLESQRPEFTVEVNLKSWSGRTTRDMAKEAGVIDFYNYVYQPFSAAVHSSWSHVGRINAVRCENPTHNMHFLPVIAPLVPDFHWCMLAAKYLKKSFAAFDQSLKLGDLPCESYLAVVDAQAQADENGLKAE